LTSINWGLKDDHPWTSDPRMSAIVDGRQD
jgi:hypothetical protein